MGARPTLTSSLSKWKERRRESRKSATLKRARSLLSTKHTIIMPRAFLLAYFTTPFSAAQRGSILERLNAPNKEFYPEDVVEDVGADAALVEGKQTDEVIAVHRELAPQRGWDLEREAYGALFLIADARTAAEFQTDEATATVEVVLVSGPQEKRLRARIGQAVGIWTALDAGTCRWSDFERDAARTGGVSGGGSGGQGQAEGSDGGAEEQPKGQRAKLRARTKGRPAERVE